MSDSQRGSSGGFTLLELMIVVAILAIVASMGVPQYFAALRTARIGKAKHELVTISHAIDAYTANNSGQLPLTLHQVGFGGRRDPWGVPYCYLNYGAGTGDGLEWAIGAGLVDPSAIQGSGTSGGAAPRPSSRGSFLPFAPPRAPQDPYGVYTKEEALALAKRLAALAARASANDVDSLAAGIAASTSFSMFIGVPIETTRRRDRYMFPLNTDYDLFSLGPNARTSVSLGETMGLDDVIRANNGGFFGVAADY